MRLLPHVTPEMLHVDFWLARLGDPDAPLLDAEEIATFNARVPEVVGVPDVFALADTLPAEAVREAITLPATRPYYGVDGAPFTASWWEELRANMALDAIPAPAPVRFGLATQRTSVRTYPTMRMALAEPGDLPFDQFQETTIDLGWPLAVVHTSADGRWALALTPLYWGWVRLDHVALGEREAVQAFVGATPFALAVAPWADVALPGEGPHQVAQMGTRLPLVGRGEVRHRVLLPRRGEDGSLERVQGVIAAQDPAWQEGYLPPTLRTVLRQAFALLGEPYAWGGMRVARPGRDCSRFVRDVWAVTGLYLPRNTGQQVRLGRTAATFAPDDPPTARVEALQERVPPGALLFLPGHVMLNLGVVEGIPYAIHDLWGYNHADGHREIVGEVVVSDLPVPDPARQAGDGPESGWRTLLERLTQAQVIGG